MNSPHVRAAVAQGLWELAPPLVRMSLLDNTQFREEFKFDRDRLLKFGDSGPSFIRIRLYDAIRQALSGESGIKVTDINGREWKLAVERCKGRSTTLAISHDSEQITLLPHVTLSSNSIERLECINDVTQEFNLPMSARNMWRDIVKERALNDDEVDEFYNDFCDTPIHVARSIRDEITSGTVSVSSLVPRSKRYYERLNGVFDGSTSVRLFASKQGRKFFKQLSSWRPYNGFLFSLFLSSHPALTAEISVELLERDDLVRAFDFLVASGDRISQLGAIEVGLRVLPERPEIQPFLLRLIAQIRDEDVYRSESRFKLLSILFKLVDGELSRTRLLSEYPPFYRRLASLSQAALICRQCVNLGMAIDPFCEWVIDQRAMDHIHFYLQSLADMRLEPRWIPEFATPSRLRTAFLGRIIRVALDNQEAIQETELFDLILGSSSESLQSYIEFPHELSVGPLEGGERVSNASFSAVLEEMEVQFRDDGQGTPPFFPLIIHGPVLPVGSELPGLAADALNRRDHCLDEFGDRSRLFTVRNGLATVAAATRSRALADELRILVRKHRRDAQYALSIAESVRVCIAAAASRSELKDWREFVGDSLTELAFGELEEDDRKVLDVHLQYLCHVDPGLWAFCSKADAALKALRTY